MPWQFGHRFGFSRWTRCASSAGTRTHSPSILTSQGGEGRLIIPPIATRRWRNQGRVARDRTSEHFASRRTSQALPLKAQMGSGAAVQRLHPQGRLIAHSQTNRARTPDPKRSYMRPMTKGRSMWCSRHSEDSGSTKSAEFHRTRRLPLRSAAVGSGMQHCTGGPKLAPNMMWLRFRHERAQGRGAPWA